MRKPNTYQKQKSESSLTQIASVFNILSGLIVISPFILSVFGRFPRSLFDYFQHSNALIAYIIILCITGWLFCFSIMFRLSNRFHSWYFDEGNVFGRYRKFRNLSIIANLAAGFIFIALVAIMIDYIFPQFMGAVLISSVIFWLITSVLWYLGFVWYSKS